MIRVLFLATLVLALTCSIKADITDFQHARQFVDWFAENNFDASIEEIEQRFDIFRANVDFILQHNARYEQGLETYRVGLNQYADLTLEEYSALVLGFRSSNATATNVTEIAESENVRGQFDRRRQPSRGERLNPWKWLCKRFRWAWWIPQCRAASSSSTGSADSSSGSADLSSSTGSVDLSSTGYVDLSSSSSGSVVQLLSSSSSAPVSLSSSSSSEPVLLSSSSAEPVLLSSSTGSSPSSSSAEPVLLSSSTGAAVINETFVDWRVSGFVGPVRNQGSCGASWAYAAVASMQSALAQQNDEFVPLSVQQVLDCAANGNRSCVSGGNFEDVWAYLFNSTSVQIANETTYPLTGTGSSQCLTNVTGSSFASAVRLPSGDESALLEAARTHPSIAAGFNVATQGWQFYADGLFTDSSCSNSTNALNHAISVVGFGTDEFTGQDYWLVQNSVGAVWGERGYAKVARGNNTCGIATEAAYVVA